jgi:hypothetical protein
MESSGDGLEECGFPCAIGSHDGDQFSLTHLKGDIVDDRDAAVANLDLRDL